MVEAARKYNRVVQAGMQSRSGAHFHTCRRLRPLRQARQGAVRRAWIAGNRKSIGQKRRSRAGRASITTCGWGRRRNGPSTPTVSITTGTGTGTTAPASSATTASTLWTWPGWLLDSTLPTRIAAGGGKFFYTTISRRRTPRWLSFDYPHCTLLWEHRIWSKTGVEGEGLGRKRSTARRAHWFSTKRAGTSTMASRRSDKAAEIDKAAPEATSRLRQGGASGPMPTLKRDTRAHDCAISATSPTAPAAPFASMPPRKPSSATRKQRVCSAAATVPRFVLPLVTSDK